MNPHESAEKSDAPERTWQHRQGDRYVLITASVVGNPERGYEIEHYLGTGEFKTIAQAKRAGLRDLYRSDDFNIGAIRNGGLAAILWMTQIVDDEPDIVAEIAEELGLPHQFDGRVGARWLSPPGPAPRPPSRGGTGAGTHGRTGGG